MFSRVVQHNNITERMCKKGHFNPNLTHHETDLKFSKISIYEKDCPRLKESKNDYSRLKETKKNWQPNATNELRLWKEEENSSGDTIGIEIVGILDNIL